MRQTQAILGNGVINSFGESQMVEQPKLIQHHVKYKEIHGVDEIVLMTTSEHVKLHNRLRRESKCKIPVDVLTKISQKAHSRTEKHKELVKKYPKIEKYKKYQLNYSRTEKRREQIKKYRANTFQGISFLESVGLNVYLYEDLLYNKNTGKISYTSRFRPAHDNILIFIGD